MEPIVQSSRGTAVKQVRENCLFCEVVSQRSREILAENGSFVAVFDTFPVNEGHALIVSKGHISSVFDLIDREGAELLELLRVAKARLDLRFKPDGYNVGINCGEAAGQTIPHLHIHLIPRYRGDVENPRGGIRNFKNALIPC